MDFCEEMLNQAKLKKERLSNSTSIEFRVGDCMQLPLPDNSFDIVTLAFGVRNFENRIQGLQEIRRILKKPHGTLFILEFSQPYWILKPLYSIYLKYILPQLARWVTGNKNAYDYLAGSIHQFPDCKTFAQELYQVGFQSVDYRRLTGGIVAIHEARME